MRPCVAVSSVAFLITNSLCPLCAAEKFAGCCATAQAQPASRIGYPSSQDHRLAAPSFIFIVFPRRLKSRIAALYFYRVQQGKQIAARPRLSLQLSRSLLL